MVLSSQLLLLLPLFLPCFLVSRPVGPPISLVHISTMLWFASTVWAVAIPSLLTQVYASPLPYAHQLEQSIDTRGAVASESDICSHIGIDILQNGGNAADAVSTARLSQILQKYTNQQSQLVGTVFCVGVVGMYHSGLGGGGFMLVRAPNGTYEFIDFRETAPAAAFQDMYKNNTRASIFGGLARYTLFFHGSSAPLTMTVEFLARFGVLPIFTKTMAGFLGNK